MLPSRNIPNLKDKILAGRLRLTTIIGEGANGVVYRAVDETTASSSSSPEPIQYAVKVVRKVDPSTIIGQAQVRELITHQVASDHPSVITLHQIIHEGDLIFLIMDYCPGGDLFDAIMTKRSFWQNDDLLRNVFVQILDAVQYCHERGIYHRDLKPDNIMISEDGTEVFLGDFGLATDVDKCKTFGCGSTYYMSPECIGDEFQFMPYSCKYSDIWALGVILLNMIVGRNPWSFARTADYHFLSYMENNDFLRYMLPVSDTANDLIKRILTFNPSARIIIPELRDEVMAMKTFFLSDEEIAHSNDIIRAAASAYAGRPYRAARSSLLSECIGALPKPTEGERLANGGMHPTFSDIVHLFDKQEPATPLPPRPGFGDNRPISEALSSLFSFSSEPTMLHDGSSRSTSQSSSAETSVDEVPTPVPPPGQPFTRIVQPSSATHAESGMIQDGEMARVQLKDSGIGSRQVESLVARFGPVDLA